MKKALYIFLGLILLISCCKNEIGAVDNQSLEIGSLATLRISAVDTIITPDIACNIARLASIYRYSHTKSAENKEVDNVVTITDSNNKPLLYAINYKDGLGYTLVSATKKYYPILACVEKGHFDESIYETGLSVLLDNYKANIYFWNTKQPVDSTDKMKNLWRQFENNNVVLPYSTKSEADIRGNQVGEWNLEGKLVHNLADVEMLLPTDVYQRFCAMAMTECNPEYDYLSNSVVLEYTISPDYSHLIKTTWNQYAPYNYSCPIKNGKHTLVGCAAVAVGQMMNYHQWPSSVSWSLFPNTLVASSVSDLSVFLYEVGKKMGTVYEENASSTYESGIKSALEEYGYRFDYAISYNESNVRSSLSYNRPVLMLGQKDLNNDEISEGGHAWICDGHVYTDHQRYFELYVTSYDEPLRLIPTSAMYVIYETNPHNLYHMNWGYGGNHDGWYRQSRYPVDSLNFSYMLKHMTNIRPNN